MNRIAAACLAVAILAAGEPATVAIELPRGGLSVNGLQPVRESLGIQAEVMSAEGMRQIFLAAAADTSLWKERRTGDGGGDWLALRDNRFAQVLVRVDCGAIPAGAEVRSATLVGLLGGAERDKLPGRIHLHRMLVPWTESASWFQPDPAAAATWDGLKAGRDFTAAEIAALELSSVTRNTPVAIPGLAATVAAWCADPAANHGLLLLFDGKAVQTSLASREQDGHRAVITLDVAARATVALDREPLARLAPDPAMIERLVLRIARARDGKGVIASAASLSLAGAAAPVPAASADADGWLEIDATHLVRSNTDAVLTSDAPLALAWNNPKAYPRFIATIRHAAPADLFPAPVRIRNGVFATVRDGHLWYGDQRLRLWGTLGFGSKERLRKMGFNAYRFWVKADRFYTPESGHVGAFAPTVQGDGSELDTSDREFAQLKAADVFIMDTALMLTAIPGAVADGSFLAGGDDWPQWRDAVLAFKNQQEAMRYLPLFDERARMMRFRHVENVLKHVNPYTGRARGADEAIAIHELANENWVVGRLAKDPSILGPWFGEHLRQRWVAWLAGRYHDDAGLTRAWGGRPGDGGLAAGDLGLQPPKDCPAARRADLTAFVLELFNAWTRDLVAHCRAQAPAGTGVATALFSTDTQYRPDLAWTWADTQAGSTNFGMYFWGMGSLLTRPPSLYVMDSTTVEGLPTIIYETNQGRPSAFRSEYPFLLATFAAWQDWDAVFFHYWGGPIDGPDERWLVERVLPPSVDHYWNAVHTSTDPVMCAAIAAAGRAFLQRSIAPAPAPAVCRVGRQAIQASGAVSLAPTAFARGARLRFEPEGDFATILDGEVKPVPGAAVAAGDAILWDWPNGRLVVDTPTAKFLVGRTAVHRFADGITVSGFDQPFTAFAIVSADGRPLMGGCTRAWISATADARNTGFAIDLAANLDGPVNQAKAIRNPGRSPVAVDHPSWTISFPQRLDAAFTAYDFALRPAGNQPMAGPTLRWKGRDMWLGMLAIAGRGSEATPEIDPVTGGHPPETAGAYEPATDASLARIPNPLPQLSWGDNPQLAFQTLRNLPLGMGRTNLAGDGERTVTITDAPGFLGGTASIEVRFRGPVMSAIAATYTQPPALADAIATGERIYGRPLEKRLGSQFEQTLVRWNADGVAITLEEIQGVLRIRWERTP